MGAYFKSLRRKAGCAALAVDCLIAVGWFRSLLTHDYITAFNRTFWSSNGEFRFAGHFNLDHRSFAWDSGPGLFPPHLEFSGLPYLIVIVPLALLSAVLLLWPVRSESAQAPNPKNNSN